VRAVSRWSPASGPDHKVTPRFARFLMALLLTLPGSACLYQGEELGLTEASVPRERMVDPWGIEFWPLFPGRDGSRTPIPWQAAAPSAGFTTGEPWLPIPDEHRAMAIDAQAADPGSVLSCCRRLLRFRKAHPALRTGALALRDAPAPLWAFERRDESERLLCVLNLSNRPTSWALEDGWASLDGHGFPSRLEGGALHLPAFGVFFGARRGEI